MLIKKKNNSSHGKRLLANTSMLYLLTFSNYFLFLITIPYQARILGPDVFGEVGFAMAFAGYFQLLLDFGFMLSATELISRHRDDKQKVSNIFSAVMWCKLILAGISSIILLILCLTVERFQTDILLYILFFMSSILASFIPDFIYRGTENMKAITIRTVLVKLFFVLLIFVLLKDKTDYYVIPILGIIGNTIALLSVGFHMKSLGLYFSRVPLRELRDTFKQSSLFFYSRIATNIYSSTNIFMLGVLYGYGANVIGYFTSADRLITAAKQGITPITDSLYPYMVKNKNFNLIKKMLLVGIPVLGVGCLVTAILAEQICVIIFGEEYRAAGEYLRLLMPVVLFAFPAMIFGFPVLSPMGLSRFANLSNISGAVIQIVQLAALFATGNLNVVNICIATCITEAATLTFRLVIVWKNRHLLKTEQV
jgi:PST family polysaccharide transporter